MKVSNALGNVCLLFIVSALNSLVSADILSANVAVDIQEPAGTYNTQVPNVLNMTVRTVTDSGVCVPGSYGGCTLNDVLNDIDSQDNFKPEIRVHFSADDYPHDGLVSNASMRQRGGESRFADQKSFRIKLDKTRPLWRGEKKIQLLKSAFDESRIRNKLSYDLFTEIPHLPSMRTQFVRLTINDQGFDHDYGLYTQVENFGKEYLQRRGWNKDSRVYKPEDFGYYEDPAMQLDATGKPLDKEAFEKIVEIKRGKSHFELINMIHDLNDDSVDFNTQIMGRYFNLDNYLSWFAVNLLLNNQDTHFHNYYLYNPKGKDDFYLVPWDYDSVLGMVPDNNDISEKRLPRWWFSHANFWEIQLHRRFLQEPGNLDLLASAVTEIKNNYLTPEKIAAKRDAYYDLVFPVIRNSPDWDHLYLGNSDPEQLAAYNRIFDKLSKQVDIQYARFMQRLYDPMTFKMNPAVISDNFHNDHSIQFSWGQSVSLVNQAIVYDLDIATDRTFKPGSIIEHVGGLSGLSHTLYWMHPRGTYYFRVIARDAAAPQRHWQEALNGDLTYENSWVELHGVVQMIVPQDGDLSGNPSQPPLVSPPESSPPEPSPSEPSPSEPSPSEPSPVPGSGGGSSSGALFLFMMLFVLRRVYCSRNSR